MYPLHRSSTLLIRGEAAEKLVAVIDVPVADGRETVNELESWVVSY
jgi:hypothetical protein